jgi:hypothetical protein
MKTYGGVDVYLHALLTSALYEADFLVSRLGRIILEKIATGTHWMGGWVGPKSSLDAVGKLKISSHSGN